MRDPLDRGKDLLGDFIDNRQYWGHAFALLRRAEIFLLDHVPNRSQRITDVYSLGAEMTPHDTLTEESSKSFGSRSSSESNIAFTFLRTALSVGFFFPGFRSAVAVLVRLDRLS